MTHSIRQTLPAILAIIFLIGCNASTAPTTTPNTMSATVNGSAWSSNIIPGVSATGITKAYKNGNVVTVTGISALDNSEITIEIMNPAVVTDSLGASGDEGIYSKVLNAADTNAYASIPSTTPPLSIYDGAVTITAYDTVAKTISGTFNFVGRLTTNPSNTVTITNGSFYQVGW